MHQDRLYQLIRNGRPSTGTPYLDLAREAARRQAVHHRHDVAIVDLATGRRVAHYLPPGPLDPGPIDTHAGPLVH